LSGSLKFLSVQFKIENLPKWLAGAVVSSATGATLSITAESDLIGELAVELDFALLGESVASNRLEGLVYVDCLFGTRLKKGDVVFAGAPLLRSFRRHL
jgi:hypothetical protein